MYVGAGVVVLGVYSEGKVDKEHAETTTGLNREKPPVSENGHGV